MSSLQDSGISDYEGATGRDLRASGGPLSNLPGPGTFKQMTKQRHAGDADSGFIGSMVGSEVSGNLSSRQQQQQPSLRLRQPSESSSERYIIYAISCRKILLEFNLFYNHDYVEKCTVV